MRISRDWQERLHPWRTRRRLYERVDALNDAIGAQQVLLDQRAARLESQQRELRQLAGTSGLSVGWEQAGAVTPDFVIVGTSRGREPGVRLYATRELAAPAVKIIDTGALASQVRLEAVMGEPLIINAHSRESGLGQVQEIWRNRERGEAEAAEKLAGS